MDKNLFRQLEEEILDRAEGEIFNHQKICAIAKEFFSKKIANAKNDSERGFIFQDIVCDFFEYKNFKIHRTKKTKDFGIDGVIEAEIRPFGILRMGLQVKYKRINSADLDSFLQALDFAEIKVGVIACKDSARLQKNSAKAKFKAMLLGRTEKIPKFEDFGLQQVFVLKFAEIICLFAEETMLVIKGIYKAYPI